MEIQPFSRPAVEIGDLANSCFDGYRLLSRCTTELDTLGARVRIQHRRFAEWAREWGVREDAPHEYPKLMERLNREYRAGTAIRDVLEEVVDTLGDAFGSAGKYGLMPVQSNTSELNWMLRRLQGLALSAVPSERRKDTLKTFLRMSWTIHNPSKFHNLIKVLRDSNDDLLYLCSPEKRQRLERSAMSALVFSADELEQKRRALIEAAKHEEEEVRGQELDGKGPKVSEWYLVLAQVVRTLDKVRRTGRNSNLQPAFLSINDFVIPDYEVEQPHAVAYEPKHKRIRVIEWKSYLVDGIPSQSLKDNVHELLRIFALDQRPADFRMLPVIGYVKDERFSRYGIIYRLPSYMGEYTSSIPPSPREFGFRHPYTLASFLDAPVLELGLRFQLAKQLANSLHLLHTAGITHRNFRPESIVFFATESRNRGGPSSYRVSLTNPFLVNYGLVKPNFSGTQSMYIHPRQYGAAPGTTRYLPMFDVYALGLVLLEIGLWQPLSTIWRNGYSPREFRDVVLSEVLRDVGGACGNTYRDVVRECLTLEAESAKECGKALCWRIAGKLDRLQA